MEVPIAYSAASKEYKVTLPYIAGGDSPLPQRIGLDILTVGVDESWRKVAVDYLDEDVKSSFILLSRPLTSEGFLHWGTKKYAVTLDVETEVLSVSRVLITASIVIYQRGSLCLCCLGVEIFGGKFERGNQKLENGERCCVIRLT